MESRVVMLGNQPAVAHHDEPKKNHVIILVCSVRIKEKWLSHGQSGIYNFWLSVQVFGCPYTYTKVSFRYRFVVVCRTSASVFFCCLDSSDFFGCPGRTGNQNFEQYLCGSDLHLTNSHGWWWLNPSQLGIPEANTKLGCLKFAEL